jgi:hypothetical protein
MTLLVGLPESFSGQIGFSLSISFHHDYPCSYITWGMNSRTVGGRSSKMESHHINMMDDDDDDDEIITTDAISELQSYN